MATEFEGQFGYEPPDPNDDMARRAAEADRLAGVNAAPEGEAPGEAPAVPDYLNEASGAVEMFAALVVGVAPKAADIWDAGTKGRVAGALAPVMEKYGFSFGASPELMLLILAGPPLYQSARLVAMTIDEKRQEAAEKAEKAKPAAPGPQVVRPTGRPAPAETPQQEVHAQMALYK